MKSRDEYLRDDLETIPDETIYEVRFYLIKDDGDIELYKESSGSTTGHRTRG